MRREQLKGHLDLLLLAVLAGGPAHGYAVITALRERSGQELSLPEGTVYPALHRLEADGLLRSYWAEQAGRRRRLYELTAEGAAALQELRGEWRRFSAGVQAVVGGLG
jgi:PadR family transcriptional regulator, regulatory protein PadR